jgi:putative ABC transport system ATP-binding protein
MTSTTLPPTTTAPAVQLVDLRKDYPGADPVPALRGVSLALATGSFTAVMGPSGSGKSTLLNIAAGLDSPTSGDVLLDGQQIGSLSADALTRLRRERIGFVFQAYNLVGHLSVADNIDLPLVLARRTPDPAWRSALIASVGLAGLEDRRPADLSGGQAQRVAIARALLPRPTVVFADEPTGALDSRTGSEVLEVLRTTARRLQQTVVVVTHDPRVAAVADRVLFLADGLLVDQLEAGPAGPISVEAISARMIGLGR